jgi:hypothetical protein
MVQVLSQLEGVESINVLRMGDATGIYQDQKVYKLWEKSRQGWNLQDGDI